LRLWLPSVACVLLCAQRRIGLPHTRFVDASCGTIRLNLLKIGAVVSVSVRRIKIAMASGCPVAPDWGAARSTSTRQQRPAARRPDARRPRASHRRHHHKAHRDTFFAVAAAGKVPSPLASPPRHGLARALNGHENCRTTKRPPQYGERYPG
jgi:hypothetical protein